MKNFLLRERFMWVAVFIIAIPTLVIVYLAFTISNNGETYFSVAGFDELAKTVRLNELMKITVRALLISAISTAIAFVASYLLVLYTSRSFRIIFFIVMTLPFLINESVRIFSWQYVLSENGFFNSILSSILRRPVHLFDGSNGSNVYVVMVITSLPFGLLINSASLELIPNAYWRSASDLKLNFINRLIKVGIPLSAFPNLASLLITFFIAFSLSSEVNYLGGDSKISIRNFVLSLLSASQFEAIFSLGFILMVLILIIAFTSRFFYLKTYRELK